MGETKIANLITVREHSEGDTVELWVNRNGRLVIRAFNECHNNHTDVDLADLLEWLQTGGYMLAKEAQDGGQAGGISALSSTKRDK
jgi:hypothetical protein